MKDQKADWIFYLQLTPKLTGKFLELDQYFKENDFSLVPLSLSHLLNLNQGAGQFHVIVVASTQEEINYFNKKIRKLSHYLIRNKRMHLYLASSFDCIDDSPLFGSTGHYHFVKLPVKLSSFCATIAQTVKNKQNQMRKWPGGKRNLGSTVG
jgi:hypothetical protein